MHRHYVQPALIMLVVQYRAAYYGQIGVASDEIMGNKLDEIEQLFNRVLIHFHGSVFTRKQYAVLIKIGVRRILHKPAFARQVHRNSAQISARGMG